MQVVELLRVKYVDDINQCGDYAIVVDIDNKRSVILACPVCGEIMACPHKIISENPLTLGQSVVSVVRYFSTSQVNFIKCGHHFWVHDNKAWII